MNKIYEIQQETLKLFQGQNQPQLSQEEINNLNLYKGLVINSMESLLAKIFAEIYPFYKEEWRNIAKDYLEQYPSQSPIYSQLCKNFPEFLGSELFIEKYSSNNYFHELAKYKYLDLEVYNSKEKMPLSNGFTQNYSILESNFNIPLIISYLSNKHDLKKIDDMEESNTVLFIYRVNLQTKTLVLNKFTQEFIKELELNKSIESVKSSFIENYSVQIKDIESQIDQLINYLKNMKILLI